MGMLTPMPYINGENFGADAKKKTVMLSRYHRLVQQVQSLMSQSRGGSPSSRR
jgi:hypothetical protein